MRFKSFHTLFGNSIFINWMYKLLDLFNFSNSAFSMAMGASMARVV